jgi:hypothetical protein
MKTTTTRVVVNGVLQDSGAFQVGTGSGRLIVGNLGVGTVLQVQLSDGLGTYCPVVRNGIAWELTPTNNSLELTTPGIYRLVSTGAALGATVQATYYEENDPGRVRVERFARDSIAAAAVVLGLGTMAYQNANAVAITGGNITGLTSLTVTGSTVLDNAGIALRVARSGGGDKLRFSGLVAGSGASIDVTDAAEGAYRPFEVQASSIVLTPVGGDIRFNRPLIALGGGAAATLGTIGGAGPTTAAQHAWMRFLDDAGNAKWVPCFI